jgi:hypothetical protein
LVIHRSARPSLSFTFKKSKTLRFSETYLSGSLGVLVLPGPVTGGGTQPPSREDFELGDMRLESFWCPEGISPEGLVRSFGFVLLYVGIAPGPPSASGRSSRQTLRNRLRYHFRGNAEGSTLRLSLGCLLSQSLGIELRRVGSGRRMTFGAGEKTLDDWLGRSARIAWMVCDEPWKTEESLIRTVSLPLNLDQNRHHLFHSKLSEIRRLAQSPSETVADKGRPVVANATRC